ncbi:DUF3093 domain-containing protein [Citricoccus sp. SGAir0253]|uniref:DUF3093 domain-containing protein n=1 Tax=Citricoccus sp. SGAir0253 TaxID=2567881 RepID=UPI0010CD2643|nr:DUF3093 domain-containing protein [Citricoccus sp. SGAir0253]QCU77880.1 DUF3093 domain-containing protein [Citricoccus sp. SGAir0253]
MHASPSDPTGQHASSSPTAEDAVRYEERLRPGWWIWVVALMIAGLSVLVFVPIGLEVGLGAAVVVFLVIAVLLRVSTPAIVVTDRTLRVGRAGIDRRYVGAVTGYRGEDATYQRGPALHGLAYMCLRGWIDPVVRIQITDERDRTPYWLTSTRHPEQLVAALGGTMARDAEGARDDAR